MIRATAAVLLVAGSALAHAQGDETFVYDPYVPTPQAIVERMLALAEVGAADLVVDLGSGDGRIVITAAKQFGARAIGVEIDRGLLAEAASAARAQGVADRVRFLARDLHEVDLREATVLTLYLLPETNRKLLPKILAEMPPGARVVSHRYAVGDWRPDATVMVEVADDWTAISKARSVHLFRVPARVAGQWEVTREDGASFRLALGQTHQFIAGVADGGGGPVELERAVVHGREIRFVLPDAGLLAPLAGDYAGTVDGEVMSGSLVGDHAARWRAIRRGGR